jgi:hypothetical protein
MRAFSAFSLSSNIKGSERWCFMARPFPLEEGGSANRAFSSPIKAASRAVIGGVVRLNQAHSESFISFLDGTFSGQVKPLRRWDTCQAAEAKLNKGAAH